MTRRLKLTEPPAWLMEGDWPDASRQARAKYAWQRRRDGLLLREIAVEMGVSRSMASDLVCDPSGELLRERHHRRRGTCVDCGADTFNGGGEPPERCRPCSIARQEAQGAETKERVAEQVREWTRIHGGPPRIADWSPSQAALGYGGSDYEKRAANVEVARRNRAAGWPSPTTVMYHWAPGGASGNWDDALIAIGVGPVQYAQRRKGLDPDEVVRLYVAEGLSRYETARRLGVTEHTVDWHLRKRGVELRPSSRPKFDHDAIVRLYAQGELTQPEVAAALGCSPVTVQRAVAAAGIGPGKGGWRARRAKAAA